MSLPPSPTFSVIYSEVIHWRPNLFLNPLSMKAAVVLPALLLQKPSSKSKSQGTQRLPGQMVEHVAQWEFE